MEKKKNKAFQDLLLSKTGNQSMLLSYAYQERAWKEALSRSEDTSIHSKEIKRQFHISGSKDQWLHFLYASGSYSELFDKKYASYSYSISAREVCKLISSRDMLTMLVYDYLKMNDPVTKNEFENMYCSQCNIIFVILLKILHAHRDGISHIKFTLIERNFLLRILFPNFYLHSSTTSRVFSRKKLDKEQDYTSEHPLLSQFKNNEQKKPTYEQYRGYFQKLEDYYSSLVASLRKELRKEGKNYSPVRSERDSPRFSLMFSKSISAVMVTLHEYYYLLPSTVYTDLWGISEPRKKWRPSYDTDQPIESVGLQKPVINRTILRFPDISVQSIQASIWHTYVILRRYENYHYEMSNRHHNPRLIYEYIQFYILLTNNISSIQNVQYRRTSMSVSEFLFGFNLLYEETTDIMNWILRHNDLICTSNDQDLKDLFTYLGPLLKTIFDIKGAYRRLYIEKAVIPSVLDEIFLIKTHTIQMHTEPSVTTPLDLFFLRLACIDENSLTDNVKKILSIAEDLINEEDPFKDLLERISSHVQILEKAFDDAENDELMKNLNGSSADSVYTDMVKFYEKNYPITDLRHTSNGPDHRVNMNKCRDIAEQILNEKPFLFRQVLARVICGSFELKNFSGVPVSIL